MEQRRTVATPPRIGIVGAGRTRNGLGPFLATFFERAECRVSAIAGRSLARVQQNAAALADRLGHEVHACRDVHELCASGIDALVIASPPEFHLEALRAAESARLPVLCEKPLAHERHLSEAAPLVARFVDTGLLLAENCHWPYALPALRPLLGESFAGAARHISLGLASIGPGRTIVQNTLSHLLSLAQAVAHIDDTTTVERVALDRPSSDFVPNVLRCHLRGPGLDLGLALHLDLGATAPRPAWLAIDEIRMERRIGRGYAFSFVRNGREVAVPDPMGQLVVSFSTCLRTAAAAWRIAEGDAARHRLRLYRDILTHVP